MPDRALTDAGLEDLSALALGKLRRILGDERGSRVFAQTLEATRLAALQTPDELACFARHLERRGGIEAAVAGLLAVSAVMRGATPLRDPA